MAQNFVQKGHTINAAASDPAAPAVGGPVVVGTIAGVALSAEGEGGNAAGECSIATKGVFNLAVKGHDGDADAPVAVGDRIYYDGGILNTHIHAVLYGKALGAVVAGETTTIPVLLIQA